jgi:hypothetical protein
MLKSRVNRAKAVVLSLPYPRGCPQDNVIIFLLSADMIILKKSDSIDAIGIWDNLDNTICHLIIWILFRGRIQLSELVHQFSR